MSWPSTWKVGEIRSCGPRCLIWYCDPPTHNQGQRSQRGLAQGVPSPKWIGYPSPHPEQNMLWKFDRAPEIKMERSAST